MNQNNQRRPEPPDNIDELVLELGFDLTLIAKNYKNLANANKRLKEHQLNMNQRLSELGKANRELSSKSAEQLKSIDKLQKELLKLKKQIKESKRPAKKESQS